jgi:hypothetical protein
MRLTLVDVSSLGQVVDNNCQSEAAAPWSMLKPEATTNRRIRMHQCIFEATPPLETKWGLLAHVDSPVWTSVRYFAVDFIDLRMVFMPKLEACFTSPPLAGGRRGKNSWQA